MSLSNNPPSQIETTTETTVALNDWLTDHPVIETEQDAREGKLLVDRATLCLGDLEAERDGLVRPLNEQVRIINDQYRDPRSSLSNILTHLRYRLNVYLQAEEEKRAAAARLAHQNLDEAERNLIEAEIAASGATEDAAAGVVVDIAKSEAEAAEAVKAFQKAERKAALAEKETSVRLGGGFRRSLSLKTKETLVVTDAILAIGEVGWTEDIMAAIIKAARAYRQLHGALPAGVQRQTERSL